MKNTKLTLIACWLLALPLAETQAQPFSLKSHKLTVTGTSTLHEWESTAEELEVKGSMSLDADGLSDVSKVVVRIPVKSIKSTKGKMMDNKTWEAFDQEKNPLITFVATETRVDREGHSVAVRGQLTMAGVTRDIDLKLAYKVLPKGEVQFKGSKKLIMSDYKMEPPTAMMGTIKVGDAVTVNLEITLTSNDNTL